MDTNYDQEIKLEANEIYQKFNIFSSKNINSTTVDPVVETRKAKRSKIQEVAENTGEKWYNMQKQSLTPELKADLEILKVGGLMDPKFYKKKVDWTKLPQYFQVGTIIEGGDEFKTARIPKGKRKANLIDQFLEDDSNIGFSKKRFLDIQSKKKFKTSKKLDKFNKLKRKGIVRA